MSAGTIVMQTDLVGGMMHTARHTLLQGRLLAAPVPQGEHATVSKSRGLLALWQRTGPELSHLLEAKGAFAALLERGFADRPVAMSIAGCDDYGRLLDALERAIDSATRPPPPVQGVTVQVHQLSLELETE